jgi:hypothetical protein
MLPGWLGLCLGALVPFCLGACIIRRCLTAWTYLKS